MIDNSAFIPTKIVFALKVILMSFVFFSVQYKTLQEVIAMFLFRLFLGKIFLLQLYQTQNYNQYTEGYESTKNVDAERLMDDFSY